MTRVRAEIGGGVCCLDLEGHATGSPAVCAAISGMICALAGYLSNRVEVEMELGEGSAHIHAKIGEKESGACEMVAYGLLQMANQYPEQVEIKNFQIS